MFILHFLCFKIRPRSEANVRRETDLNEKDVDLISPKFLTRPPGSGYNPDSNPQSLVSSWSQLDSGTNSRLEELRVEDDGEEELYPCQGSTEDDSDKNEDTEAISESVADTCDKDISICDNNGDTEENGDKENVSPDEEGEEETEAGTETKPGKKKNKKRRKHAKKKPKEVTVNPAETIEVT